MPEQIDPRGQDNPSTYFVEDRSSNAEMIRLMIQDRTITEGMGGPLAEQPNPASLHRVLDVGCGPGGWILEAAGLYPHMELVGIDISWRMIEYARAQTQAQRLSDGVEFLVMDALHPLDFPDGSFDLVNARLASSFMLIKDWPRLLQEMLRVTCPGGTVHVTEGGNIQSSSPALTRLGQMMFRAGYKAGQSTNPEIWGITSILAQLLSESGCQSVQTKAYTLEYPAGTVAAQNFAQDSMYLFQTLRPFLRKWDCAPEDYDAIYEQALIEMQQNNFHATWDFLTAWGTKPNE
jgi:ubiquinone/menaquinone biosynthesis C-methylase UbiE